ncbi:hypothetical protein R3P38DRAFT_3452347 [Favolaschia claudopus]|uniref:Uncharacterized protein n=1 Tax=Favolaschia claudopus TaxID=2862362 RepID=A0AAV9ZJZ0_9AGAR
MYFLGKETDQKTEKCLLGLSFVRMVEAIISEILIPTPHWTPADRGLNRILSSNVSTVAARSLWGVGHYISESGHRFQVPKPSLGSGTGQSQCAAVGRDDLTAIYKTLKRSSLTVRNITVDVPVYGTTENNKKKKAAPVLTRIIVPADLPPADFLSRMHAQMNVDPETAMLGWKEAQERCGDPYHRLSSEQDVKDAFRDLIKVQESTRLISREVRRSRRSKTTKKPEKPSETAVAVPELHNVQEKLSCMEHPGKNRCYPDPLCGSGQPPYALLHPVQSGGGQPGNYGYPFPGEWRRLTDRLLNAEGLLDGSDLSVHHILLG